MGDVFRVKVVFTAMRMRPGCTTYLYPLPTMLLAKGENLPGGRRRLCKHFNSVEVAQLRSRRQGEFMRAELESRNVMRSLENSESDEAKSTEARQSRGTEA